MPMTDKTSSKHKNIPEDLMQRFLAREITSKELAKATGYHPVYLRRTIRRDPKPKSKIIRKKELLEARENLRRSIAHLPATQIADQACVSMSTAMRIKKKYGK